MKPAVKYLVSIFLFVATVMAFTPVLGDTASDTIFYIPVEGEVNPALADFIAKGIGSAREEGVSAVVLEISTLGGRVDSALDIRDTVVNAGIPTVAYIKERAISAGVMIAISAEKVVMAPGSTIGSAETIPYTEKNISFWAGELRALAERRGRDPEIIAAMADRDIEIPGVVKKGKLLNLSASKAVELGVADAVVHSREELEQWLGLGNARVVEVREDFQVKLAKLISSSVASGLLLTVGFLGLLAEVFVAGFGVAGTIGLLSLGLFFAGHVLAGHASWAVLILFAVGIILLLIEMFVPGFGIPGIGGLASIVASIVMASQSIAQAVVSLGISLILSIGLLFVLLKFAPRSKYLDRLILSTQQRKEEGYVNRLELSDLANREGIALTPLRPAGAADIGGSRVDVITRGEFIQKGERIKVVKVEGNKVVVERIK